MVNQKRRSRNSSRSRLLHLLKEQSRSISGEVISQELQISRVAVWKAIQKLKEEGYRIDSGKQGYRLLDSKTKDMDLEEIPFQGEVVYLPRTGSTMEDSRELQKKGIKDFLLIAGEQSHGMGRNQRKWESTRGGLFITTGGTAELPLAWSGLLSSEILLGIARYFREEQGIPIEVKWPNDLYLEGKKIGGFLTEYQTHGERIRTFSLGLGLNVNNSPPQEQPSESLKHFTGREWNCSPLIGNLASIQRETLETLKQGRKPEGKHRLDALIQGRAILDHCWEGPLKGKVSGLDRLGNLLWECSSGIRHISAGECNSLRFI